MACTGPAAGPRVGARFNEIQSDVPILLPKVLCWPALARLPIARFNEIQSDSGKLPKLLTTSALVREGHGEPVC